jgi:hypothetical protein
MKKMTIKLIGTKLKLLLSVFFAMVCFTEINVLHAGSDATIPECSAILDYDCSHKGMMISRLACCW